MISRCKLKGFTLLEVMITVVIVAILAAIAIPSYDSYIRKSRRSDAMSSLLRIQLEQEKLRTSCVRYAENYLDADGTIDNPVAVTCGADAGTTDLGHASNVSTEGYYLLTIEDGADATTFIAKATPTGAQLRDTVANGGCGNFVIDQNGPNYTNPNANRTCWQR